MEMKIRNNYGLFEEVTGPALYGWMNKPETYSTTSFIVIVRNDPIHITMSPTEQVRLILSFYGFSKTELAQIIGISRPALYAWIDGTSEPERENHDKLSALAQLAHDMRADPSFTLFHGYINRPIPGYDKSLLEYLSGTLDDMDFLSALVKNISRMTVERKERLDTMPKARYSVDTSTLDDNLSSLSDGA